MIRIMCEVRLVDKDATDVLRVSYDQDNVWGETG